MWVNKFHLDSFVMLPENCNTKLLWGQENWNLWSIFMDRSLSLLGLFVKLPENWNTKLQWSQEN